MDMSTYRSVNISNDRPGARQRIADAASQLFAEQGFAATSMRQIASVAGVTKPMVYYYFGSKDDLHRRMVEEATVGVKACLNAAIAPAGSCHDKLTRLAAAHAQLSTISVELTGGGHHELVAEAIRAVLAEGELCREIRSVEPDVFTAVFCGGLAANDPTALVDILWRGLTCPA
jgi:AcrR family transcriptional regulator